MSKYKWTDKIGARLIESAVFEAYGIPISKCVYDPDLDTMIEVGITDEDRAIARVRYLYDNFCKDAKKRNAEDLIPPVKKMYKHIKSQ